MPSIARLIEQVKQYGKLPAKKNNIVLTWKNIPVIAKDGTCQEYLAVMPYLQ